MCHDTRKSSSSDLTVESVRSESVLTLGKKLVDELGPNDSVDTLGRWMAHYIEELIHDAELAEGDNSFPQFARCADAILKLWNHRNEMPRATRPFRDFEPILRALQSLDPDDKTPRYFRAERNAVEEHEEKTDTKQWLKIADEIDQSAKILIRFCLARAAKDPVERSWHWLDLVEPVDLDQLDIEILRTIRDEKDLVSSAKLTEAQRKQIQDRIQRLESFIDMASRVSVELKARLQQLDAIDGQAGKNLARPSPGRKLKRS